MSKISIDVLTLAYAHSVNQINELQRKLDHTQLEIDIARAGWLALSDAVWDVQVASDRRKESERRWNDARRVARSAQAAWETALDDASDSDDPALAEAARAAYAADRDVEQAARDR